MLHQDLKLSLAYLLAEVNILLERGIFIFVHWPLCLDRGVVASCYHGCIQFRIDGAGAQLGLFLQFWGPKLGPRAFFRKKGRKEGFLSKWAKSEEFCILWGVGGS